MNLGLEVALFYVSVAALAVGVMRALRASVERNARDRAGVALAAGGVLGLIIAVIVFITGSRAELPF